ncbi:ABC transporter substrate-binding protein [Rhizobium sp. CSW-27]|uniref:ABC transporter substrate-binding protein n=1 Tax=Rhizobium sp. CSW-27 TaxID=2839985 RepID=UPI001C021CD8|nr:ABC transporter substrate-binding protein [Rhizobium sp. CSW-27]MBT9373235.1 peptide ABC transporter substrate-binding protein [Rhizobium sp. CSW-27]
MRITVLVGASALIAAAAFSPAQAEVPNDRETLALASRIDNNSFDRAELAIGNQVQFWQPVFDTLIIQKPDGSFGPGLATEWSYNADATALTLTLRQGVRFTDGAPFDANAVKANLEYLAAGAGPNGYMARSISEIKVISDTQVQLILAEPDPAMLWNLSTVGGAMASPASLGAAGSDTAPVGSGPYVFDAAASVQGSQYVYNRNPEYWDTAAFPFDRVTVTPLTDNAARMNAIFAGQVDGAIGDSRVVAESEAKGFTVTFGDIDWAGITLADRKGAIAPPLADVRVRQAINLAFDTASILKFVDLGHGKLSDQIFPEGNGAYDPALEDRYPYDPEKARSLLAEAGYPDGFDLVFPEVRPFAAFYPIVQQQLADIGIRATFEALPPGSALPVLRSGKYAAFVFNFGSANAWTDFQQYLTTNAPYNTAKVDDPVLTELVRKAQFATGEAQLEAFREVNRHVVENAYFAPWYRRFAVYVSGKDITVQSQPGNIVPYLRNYGIAR